MSVASVLSAGRRAAEARMTSRATIRRKTGETTQDESTGREVPVWDEIYADLPFRLGGANAGSSGSRTLNIADTEIEIAVRVGHFPHDTSDLRDGDLIDVTAGENAGLVLRIVEATWQDQATARRVPVLTVDRPEEW